VRRHRSWVRSLTFAIVGHSELAEDLTQETFCRAYQNAARYQSQGNFTAWLKRIAVNLGRDALRSRKTAETVPVDEMHETLVDKNGVDPLEALASEVLREEMRDAIASLPDEQRLALAMYYFGNMSLQDVAWAMKCPVGTVKSRLFNGLRRVRRRLAAHWENGGDGNDG
jgi:RNA polymerase sigma-70 factor (ECF subfamily)